MTKETKNTVASETIVKELEKYAKELHDDSVDAMETSLEIKDEETFVQASLAHTISHALKAILAGKSADEAMEITFPEDEEDEKRAKKVVKHILEQLLKKMED